MTSKPGRLAHPNHPARLCSNKIMLSRPRRPDSDQHAENYSPTTESGLTPNHYVRSSGFFAYVTADLLQRSDHRSVQALETDIRTWVKGWNENPKPFIWTK